MADKKLINPENVPGKFYVDNTCVDCDQCRNIAPKSFKRQDDGNYSYVFKQPQTAEEIAEAEEALTSCPTESIGNDGM
jgi:ferredoxin